MDNNNLYNDGQPTGEGYTQPVPEAPVYSQDAYQANPYDQGVGSQPQAPKQSEEPVTVGEWVVSFLLLMIPCVNIVLMFVWAFGSSEKKSKSNFFKAYLIIWAICVVLSIIIGIIFGAAVAASIAAMS